MKKSILLLFVALASISALAQDQPKVFIQSASSGSNVNAARNQTIEMSKDFQKVCPGVKITIRQDLADYTLILNHIEHGLFIRDNQIEVADKDGSLMTTKEGGSIKGNTKYVCTLIMSDWQNTAIAAQNVPVAPPEAKPAVLKVVEPAPVKVVEPAPVKVVEPTPTLSSQATAETATEGTASVTSEPDGSDIFIDSVGHGRTPALLKLKPGQHSVQVVHSGYKDWVSEIEVKAGSIVNVTATLQK
jgi:hypothetical protein